EEFRPVVQNRNSMGRPSKNAAAYSPFEIASEPLEQCCVSIRGTARRTMAITKPEWRRGVRIAAIVAAGAALLLARDGGLNPLKAADSLEVLEVRPTFFVIATASSNISVQVGEDGVVVVDPGTSADAPSVLAAIKRISPKPIRYIFDTGP